MKYIIAVDVDGVIRDFSTDLYRVVKEYYPHYMKPGTDKAETREEIKKEMTDWDLEDTFDATREEIQRIYREEHSETILGNGTPYLNNIKSLKKEISKDEHTFICITSQHPICCHHTLTWLGKHELNFQSIHFRKGRKKWLVECDYLIDDSPNNYKYWKNGRGSDNNFLLYNQRWNEKVNATNRVNNIDDAMKIINAQ